jgi:hypothetical protein
MTSRALPVQTNASTSRPFRRFTVLAYRLNDHGFRTSAHKDCTTVHATKPAVAHDTPLMLGAAHVRVADTQTQTRTHITTVCNRTVFSSVHAAYESLCKIFPMRPAISARTPDCQSRGPLRRRPRAAAHICRSKKKKRARLMALAMPSLLHQRMRKPSQTPRPLLFYDPWRAARLPQAPCIQN